MGIAIFVVIVIFAGAGRAGAFWLRRDAQQIERVRVENEKTRADTERIIAEQTAAPKEDKTL